MKEHTFTLNGMSKAYAMDGWRLGYVAAPEEYILAMNKFHQHNTTCAPNFVQVHGAAALNQEGDEVEEMVKEYKRRRDYAVKAINAIPGISCQCPKGAFYIFINCKSLGMKSAELSAYLLEMPRSPWFPVTCLAPAGKGTCGCPLPPVMIPLWRAARSSKKLWLLCRKTKEEFPCVLQL